MSFKSGVVRDGCMIIIYSETSFLRSIFTINNRWPPTKNNKCNRHQWKCSKYCMMAIVQWTDCKSEVLLNYEDEVEPFPTDTKRVDWKRSDSEVLIFQRHWYWRNKRSKHNKNLPLTTSSLVCGPYLQVVVFRSIYTEQNQIRKQFLAGFFGYSMRFKFWAAERIEENFLLFGQRRCNHNG